MSAFAVLDQEKKLRDLLEVPDDFALAVLYARLEQVVMRLYLDRCELFAQDKAEETKKKEHPDMSPVSVIPVAGWSCFEVVFEINGSEVYKKMKYESGVHRVQRIPETEKNGRTNIALFIISIKWMQTFVLWNSCAYRQ
jgi:hypothetical protein